MIHTKFDLGHQPAGTVVRVTLEGTEANVRLLDRSNYREYAADRRHHYIGGHYRSSPVTLQVPSSGHYCVAVDFGGYQGRGKASVQVLTNA
jgi:hypothetical protein